MYRHYQNPMRYSLSNARWLIDRSMAAAAELRRDGDMLPRVEPDGNTACPHAEDLYYKKEKAAQFVNDDLGELQRFLVSCTATISLLQHKSHEVAGQREGLHSDGAKDYFANAERKLAEELRDHQQMRSDLRLAITEVQATLREAGTKQFPGGNPRGPFGERVHSDPRVPQTMETLTKDNAKDTIRRLLRSTKDL